MELAIIIKTSQDDDNEVPVKKEIKVCSSVEAAKQAVIDELQEEFELEEECNTYARIANELANSGIICHVCGNSEFDNTIWWYDNDKGEQFDIIPMSDSEDYYQI